MSRSNCFHSICYRMIMDSTDFNQFRLERLAAAIDKLTAGNKSEFGRLLGYKDGAFVRQMLAGTRPISEKTIHAIEALRGMQGWFREQSAPPEIWVPRNPGLAKYESPAIAVLADLAETLNDASPDQLKAIAKIMPEFVVDPSSRAMLAIAVDAILKQSGDSIDPRL